MGLTREQREELKASDPAGYRAMLDQKNARARQKRQEDHGWAEQERIRSRARSRREKEKRSAYWRKRKYGISQEQYDALLRLQGNVCAICRSEQDVSLAVDHCHKTGVVRGLLCSECNLAVGLLKDKAYLARRVGDYLERGGKLRDVAAQNALPI